MQPISVYRDQHKEIMKMIEELRPLLDKQELGIRPVAKTAQRILCEMVAKVQDHLAKEDKELYPTLLTDSEAKTRSVTWGLVSGEHTLRQWFREYSKKWLNLERAVDRSETIVTYRIHDIFLPPACSPTGCRPLRPLVHAPRGAWLRYNSLE